MSSSSRRRRLRRQRPEGLDHARPPLGLDPALRPHGPRTSKHQGISCLLVDMKSPGITVRPVRQMTGDSEFNEVFFEDVRVPKGNLLGQFHAGWQVLITTLMHERAGISELGSEQIIDHLVELAKTSQRGGRRASKDSYVRQQLAQFAIEVQARKLNGLRSLTKRLKAHHPVRRDRSASSAPPSSPSEWRSSQSSSRGRSSNRRGFSPCARSRPVAASDPLFTVADDRGRDLGGQSEHHRRTHPRAPQGALNEEGSGARI